MRDGWIEAAEISLLLPGNHTRLLHHGVRLHGDLDLGGADVHAAHPEHPHTDTAGLPHCRGAQYDVVYKYIAVFYLLHQVLALLQV